MELLNVNHMHNYFMDIIGALSDKNQPYDKLLDIFLVKLMEITDSDAGTLYLVKDSTLYFHIIKNISMNVSETPYNEEDNSIWPPIPLNENFIDNISAYVAIKKEVVVIDDIYADKRFNFTGSMDYDTLTGYNTHSMLTLPLLVNEAGTQETVGVIQLINAIDKKTGKVCSYNEVVDITAISTLCGIATNILTNYLHVQENKLLLDSIIGVTIQAIAERSAYSKNHSQNVAFYCRSFADYLNRNVLLECQKIDLGEIEFAALLHDIGKIITPLEIMDKADRLGSKIHELRYRFAIKEYQLEISALTGSISDDAYAREMLRIDDALSLVESVNEAISITDAQAAKIMELSTLTYTSPRGGTAPVLSEEALDALLIRFGTLTAKERSIMQNHVVITSRLLDKMVLPKHYKKATTWAKNHHELLDGSGYPAGLKSEDIDLGSRVLTIIDIFDALISNDRPYKRGIPIEKSIEILRQMANDGKLDKNLVEHFADSRLWENAPNLPPQN